MLTLPPVSLYIHIPWCVRKCPYCDFNSHEQEHIPEADYIAKLVADFRNEMPLLQGRNLGSIFFGGGTPSLFSGDAIARLLDQINQLTPINKDIEITLEANPGTAEQEKFSAFFRAGINRLSIGIQSFDKHHLQALGRIHDTAEALTAIAMAREAGFDNINIDLMHGLPGQTIAGALNDLGLAIDLQLPHLSWYQLTIEPNTGFHKQPPVLPDEDTLWEINQQGLAMLADAGYQHYEISAFCRDGKHGQHNTNYWRFGDYIGIGAGAHGKITLPGQQQVIRRQKTRLPQHYLNTKDPLAQQTTVTVDELPFEFMMNVLRLTDGAETNLFPRFTGLSLAHISAPCEQLRSQGMLDPSMDRFVLTPQGRWFLNDVLAVFLK